MYLSHHQPEPSPSGDIPMGFRSVDTGYHLPTPFHQIPPTFPPTNSINSFPEERTLTANIIPSDDSIPTSLTSKLNNFYLQTPSIAATPVFSQSPNFVQGLVLHTPNSLVMVTPNVAQDKFHPSPEFISGGGPYQPEPVAPSGVLSFNEGLQLSYVDVESQPSGPGLGPDPVINPLANLVENLQHNGEIFVPHTDDSDTVTQESPNSVEYFVSFKRGPSSGDSSALTIDDFLHEDPFSTMTSTTDTVDEESGKSTREEDLSKFLDFNEMRSSPVPLETLQSETVVKSRSSRSPPARSKPKFSQTKAHIAGSNRVLHKLKSFTTGLNPGTLAGPAFSLEECLNEFHITEGNYAFQDETERLNMQLGPVIPPTISKRKSSSKLPKSLTRPLLRKLKTTNNLCLQNAFRNSPKVLKNLESGLNSFQLNLNNASSE